MSNIFPIKLKGENLGERHKYLNILVNESFNSNISFDLLRHAPEESVIDRFFKIDLASKYRMVDYVVENLQTDDIVYASRALKCTWLITDSQYRDIINPTHLEERIFPAMLTTAVTKMKHSIHLNLKDENRCLQFYQYYKMINIEYAEKFLAKCKADVILNEIEVVSTRITPQYMKLLTEKCPDSAELYYYKWLKNNKSILGAYLKQDIKYYNKLKFLLKAKPEPFFYIIENLYNRNKFKKLNKKLTKFIMKQHKNKVLAKPELYFVWVLNLPTVGKYLNTDEIKEAVIKLARAENILGNWFTYKNVEPLLKWLGKTELAAFKKQIFVDKSFGEILQKMSYPLPEPPRIDNDRHVFSSSEEEDIFPSRKFKKRCRRCLRKKKSCPWNVKEKTLLDRLFDSYRFCSFPNTFFELKKLLLTESSHNNRMMIMNVLVSKSGGKEEQVRELLEYLVARHINEPGTVRAAVVRSLVRRAQAYRLSDHCWKLVTTFSHSLTPQECNQYTHAAFIRQCLHQQPLSDDLNDKFLTVFDTLDEYDLTRGEKNILQQYLINMLFGKAKIYEEDNNGEEIVNIFWKILQIVNKYELDIKSYPEAIHIIKNLVQSDLKMAEPILLELFKQKSNRRIFFMEYFNIIQNECSYMNALRHETSVFNLTDNFKQLVKKGNLKHDRFFMKLSIYFKDDLAKKYLDIMKEICSEGGRNSYPRLCRSICILKDNDLPAYIESVKLRQKDGNILARHLKANIHMARPTINLNTANWKLLGAPAVGTLLRATTRSRLKEWLPILTSINDSGFSKLALRISLQVLDPSDLAITLNGIRKPLHQYFMHKSFNYIRRKGSDIDPIVWNEIKKIFRQVDIKKNDSLRDKYMNYFSKVPDVIKLDYVIIFYRNFKNSDFMYEIVLMLQYFTKHLHKLDQTFVSGVIAEFIEKDFVEKKIFFNTACKYDQYIESNIKLLSRYLLHCKTEDEQNERFTNVGEQFLSKIETMKMEADTEEEKNSELIKYLTQFLTHLKCNRIFFNIDYFCVLPLFQKILQRMQLFLPIDKYFKVYSQIHITMIYFKSIRQAIKQKPNVFAHNTRTQEEAVNIVGYIFGKYMTKEINELVATYFVSVRELYFEYLQIYWRVNFYSGKTNTKLLIAFIESILEEKDINAALLTCEILNGNIIQTYKDEEVEDIVDTLKKIDDVQVKMFIQYYDL